MAETRLLVCGVQVEDDSDSSGAEHGSDNEKMTERSGVRELVDAFIDGDGLGPGSLHSPIKVCRDPAHSIVVEKLQLRA
jgi:hypothetical protein